VGKVIHWIGFPPVVCSSSGLWEGWRIMLALKWQDTFWHCFYISKNWRKATIRIPRSCSVIGVGSRHRWTFWGNVKRIELPEIPSVWSIWVFSLSGHHECHQRIDSPISPTVAECVIIAWQD
jgi:hypothetical protein